MKGIVVSPHIDIEIQVTNKINEVAQLKTVDTEIENKLTVVEEQVNGEFFFHMLSSLIDFYTYLCFFCELSSVQTCSFIFCEF